MKQSASTPDLRVHAPGAAAARVVLLGLFFITGSCGLTYEIVWSRLLVRVMGASTFATSTVLVAFMAGLALGSYIGGKLAARFRRLPVVYGLLEICVGLYALALPTLLDAAAPLYRTLYLYSEGNFVLLTLVRFGVCAALVIVPTTLMGATLPLLVQFWGATGRRAGGSVAALYGVNAGGAVVGAAAAGFALVPFFGIERTLHLAAGLNVLVGIVAMAALWAKAPQQSIDVHPVSDELSALRRKRPAMARVAAIAFGLSGAAAMAYQVAWTRALVVTIGPHTYSFTCIVTAYILGLSLGSLFMRRRADRVANPLALFGLLEIGIAAAALLVSLLMDFVPIIAQQINAAFGDRFQTLMVLNFAVVAAIVLAPTIQMGAIFPLIGRICTTRDDHAGEPVGRAYAMNTIGTIVGAFVAGFVLIPSSWCGSQGTLLAACALNAAIGLAIVAYAATDGIRFVSPWPIVIAIAVIVMPVPLMTGFRWDRSLLARATYLTRTRQAVESDVLYYREGVDGTVAVTVFDGAVSLRVSGKVDASNSTADGVTQLALGHVPSLLTRRADRAMVLGLGSGMTASAVACNRNVGEIDCLEISGGVIEAARYFMRYNYNILEHPRVRVIRGDGRNHLLLTDRTYGMIVSEPSNPWMAGVANLFTREFYELCHDRLEDDGWLCAWMHAYHVSPADFRMVIRTVADVFPFVSIWGTGAPDYLILACKLQPAVPLDELLATLRDPLLSADLARIGWSEPGHFLRHYLSGGESLMSWVGDGPLHRDDHPTLEFDGPQALLRGRQYADRIFMELSDFLSNPLDDVLVADAGAADVRALRDAIDRAHAARMQVAISMYAMERREVLRCLSAAHAAVEYLPDDLRTHHALRQACTVAAETLASQSSQDAELAFAYEKICGELPESPAPPPLLLPLSSPSLPGGPPPGDDPLAEYEASSASAGADKP